MKFVRLIVIIDTSVEGWLVSVKTAPIKPIKKIKPPSSSGTSKPNSEIAIKLIRTYALGYDRKI